MLRHCRFGGDEFIVMLRDISGSYDPLEVAERLHAAFEGAGLDGVVAKPVDLPYRAGKRAMTKITPAPRMPPITWPVGSSDPVCTTFRSRTATGSTRKAAASLSI